MFVQIDFLLIICTIVRLPVLDMMLWQFFWTYCCALLSQGSHNMFGAFGFTRNLEYLIIYYTSDSNTEYKGLKLL